MTVMDAEIAGSIRSLDPVVLGTRIRRARLAAGLTQGQLADGLVSAAYVSRIEVGNRRPDTTLLQRLAERLGTTAEELILGVSHDERAAAELELDYGELELRSGEPEQALRRIAGVVERGTLDGVPALDARARGLQAAAWEALGRYDDAIVVWEDLAAEAPRDVAWLRILISLSRCYRECGDLARAIEVGESVAARLDEWGLAGTDEAVQLAVTVTAAYVERGDVHLALRRCTRSIEEADRLGTPRARAAAYWNASVMRSQYGDVAAAAPLAHQALRLLEQTEDSHLLGRLHSALASIELRLDPPDVDAAEASVAEALRQMAATGDGVVHRSRARLTSAKIAYLRGRLDQTAEIATSCLAETGDAAPLLGADAHVMLGRVAAARRDLAGAREHYLRAVHVLTAVGADRQAAQQWFELGGLLQHVGDESSAMDAYRRAAASTGLASPDLPVVLPQPSP